jgi:hypothetical protein
MFDGAFRLTVLSRSQDEKSEPRDPAELHAWYAAEIKQFAPVKDIYGSQFPLQLLSAVDSAIIVSDSDFTDLHEIQPTLPDHVQLLFNMRPAAANRQTAMSPFPGVLIPGATGPLDGFASYAFSYALKMARKVSSDDATLDDLRLHHITTTSGADATQIFVNSLNAAFSHKDHHVARDVMAVLKGRPHWYSKIKVGEGVRVTNKVLLNHQVSLFNCLSVMAATSRGIRAPVVSPITTIGHEYHQLPDGVGVRATAFKCHSAPNDEGFVVTSVTRDNVTRVFYTVDTLWHPSMHFSLAGIANVITLPTALGEFLPHVSGITLLATTDLRNAVYSPNLNESVYAVISTDRGAESLETLRKMYR